MAGAVVGVHEAAEEEVSHPHARRELDHGGDVIDRRQAATGPRREVPQSNGRSESRGRSGRSCPEEVEQQPPGHKGAARSIRAPVGRPGHPAHLWPARRPDTAGATT
ncbi:hypothetical protein GCM10022224_070680 [Nonomuraea antimicrobica]|uniref:Uncharacterized protein n=1 Tax=Nonomuraea antimicrobica TaxID=561173 RepID=A0ABP7CUU9_9ACTN